VLSRKYVRGTLLQFGELREISTVLQEFSDNPELKAAP
jgi:hypothetical protein